MDGKIEEFVPDQTVANTSTLQIRKALFHKIMNGQSGINGPVTLGVILRVIPIVQAVRGVRSNEDAVIVQLQRVEDLQLIAKRYASCIRRDSAKRAMPIVR